MAWEYSEDNLNEQTAIDLFFLRLGWDTAIANNKESFGEGSTLEHLHFFWHWQSPNPKSDELIINYWHNLSAC